MPAQEDRIDDQIDAVNKNIKEDKEAWSEVKKRKGDELAEAKEKKAEGLKEFERIDKEDREKRKAAGEDVQVKDVQVPAVEVEKGTDVEMDGGKDAVAVVVAPVEFDVVVSDAVMEEVAESALSIKGAAATTGGDEDELDFD